MNLNGDKNVFKMAVSRAVTFVFEPIAGLFIFFSVEYSQRYMLGRTDQ